MKVAGRLQTNVSDVLIPVVLYTMEKVLADVGEHF